MNGVTFGNKHSYKDWGLLLKSRPVITPPKAKTVYIDIPGSDGVIDLTESLTGDVQFNNRTIKCEFVVIDARIRWANIYSEIMDYLHGQKLRVRFDEDPTYYYEGRLQVNEWKSDKVTSTITIEGNVEPYKYELFSSTEDWEWDSFNFESGIIRDYRDIGITTVGQKVTIIGSRKQAVPTITVKSDNGNGLNLYGTYGGKKVFFTLKDGTYKDPKLIIYNGNNDFTFYNSGDVEANGTITFDFRGGRL